MQGYVGTEPVSRDGYFLTGDIGYWKNIGGKRFFFLIGRSKEIIIKGGVNISPVAVENALKKISSDIEQVYVVGAEDERYGEEIGAIIVWRSGTDEPSALRRLKLGLLLEQEILNEYETPKYFATVTADELPMTSTGKVQRTILKKIFAGKFEPLYDIMKSGEFRFIIIHPHSEFEKTSLSLYNHCWQPLVQNEYEYKKYLGKYLTLGAIDTYGALTGQISFSYGDKKITCVSICSASFKPRSVPKIATVPSLEFVWQYLLNGDDPVMNFHRKLGAELVEVINGGRSEDASSLGYTMLLHYPSAEIAEMSGPVSNQLIQATLMWARDIGADVYAVSRPGGLATYLWYKQGTV